MKFLKTTTAFFLFCVVFPLQSAAHHAMGGDLPTSAFHGLLSGLAHPVIGIDHLAFLIVMGITAAFTNRPLAAPLAFIVATVVGCMLLRAGITVPGLETAVAASVVIVGAIVLAGKKLAGALYAALFATAGLLHGMAYGAAIIGAETSPLLAYLVGFAVIQYAIAVGVARLTRRVSDSAGAIALQPRLAGAVATGVGLAILLENVEGLLIS